MLLKSVGCNAAFMHAGIGLIAGRPVCVYSQDFTIFGGSLLETHAAIEGFDCLQICFKGFEAAWARPRSASI